MCCVVCCVLVFGGGGVVCCVVCCVVVWWWCVLFFCYFSQFSSFSFLLSLFPSLFFPCSLFSSSFFLLYSLLATKHCGKNRSTNTAANFEAFECDLAQGKCTAVGSLPSSLLSLSSSSKKVGNFLLQEYFRRGIYFYYSFKLIPKNRRRVKLQSLHFYINSKTIGL